METFHAVANSLEKGVEFDEYFENFFDGYYNSIFEFGNNGRLLEECLYMFLTRLTAYLINPEYENFPIFESMQDILLAGGLPVGFNGVIDSYKLRSGSFIVFWPYEEDPEFSDKTCQLEQRK